MYVCMFLCPSSAIILIHSSTEMAKDKRWAPEFCTHLIFWFVHNSSIVVVFLSFLLFSLSLSLFLCISSFSCSIFLLLFLVSLFSFAFIFIEEDRAHNFTESFAVVAILCMLFISSLYLCHSSNFQSIYTVRMSFFSSSSFSSFQNMYLFVYMCMCARLLCFRLNSSKNTYKLLYDRILCCVYRDTTESNRLTHFVKRKKFRYNSTQWKAL